MLYTFFVKKDKSHRGISPIARLIKYYYKNFIQDTDDTVILSFPGYMSTTVKTIDDFISKIDFQKEDYVYFTKGMNGKRIVPTTSKTIVDMHNAKFNKVSYLSLKILILIIVKCFSF